MKLNKKQTEELLKLPESGMGYHRVDVTLKNGIILKDKIVMNSSILAVDKHIQSEDIVNISLTLCK